MYRATAQAERRQLELLSSPVRSMAGREARDSCWPLVMRVCEGLPQNYFEPAPAIAPSAKQSVFEIVTR